MQILSNDELTKLQQTKRCRPEVRNLAEKFKIMEPDQYNRLAKELTEQGEAHALGILLNVGTVNEIQFDPEILAETFKSLDNLTDAIYLYKFQDETAIDSLLEIAQIEDVSMERQALAGCLAAELAVKFDAPRQPVRKVLWKLSTEIHTFDARMALDTALAIIDAEEHMQAPRESWFIERNLMRDLPKNRPPEVIGGEYTVRRPVAKLGRNQPCHCGSGKKYKKCCYRKDQELMRDASQYEGITKSQLRKKPALVDDTSPIEEMRAYELKKLKPSQLNDDQLFAAYRRADIFGLRGLALEMLLALKERPGKDEFAEGHMGDLFNSALMAQDKEVADKIFGLVPEELLFFLDSNKLHYELLSNPNTYSELETMCAQSITGNAEDHNNPLVDLSYSFENLRPALSIVFARAAIASFPNQWLDNESLLDVIKQCRIRLDLAPFGDPIEDYMEWILESSLEKKKEAGKERTINRLREQLSEAKEKSNRTCKELQKRENELADLEDKARKLQDQVEQKKDNLKSLARKSALQSAGNVNDTTYRQQIPGLKKKIEALKEEIRSQQDSRRQLRKELQDTSRKREAQSSVRQEGRPEPEAPEGAWENVDGPEQILVPEFTDTFRKNCEKLPSTLAAKALQTAVGFATRDVAVLRQTKSIERLTDIFRVRVGLRYRLMVCYSPKSSPKILDIIPRENLKTWVRQQTRGPRAAKGT